MRALYVLVCLSLASASGTVVKSLQAGDCVKVTGGGSLHLKHKGCDKVSFGVYLSKKPTSDVKVTLSVVDSANSASTRVTLSKTQLTFTNTTYSIKQTVVASEGTAGAAEAIMIAATVVSDDADYVGASNAKFLTVNAPAPKLACSNKRRVSACNCGDVGDDIATQLTAALGKAEELYSQTKQGNFDGSDCRGFHANDGFEPTSCGELTYELNVSALYKKGTSDQINECCTMTVHMPVCLQAGICRTESESAMKQRVIDIWQNSTELERMDMQMWKLETKTPQPSNFQCGKVQEILCEFDISCWTFIPPVVNQVVVAVLVAWMIAVCCMDNQVYAEVDKDEEAKIPKTRRESVVSVRRESQNAFAKSDMQPAKAIKQATSGGDPPAYPR